MRKKYQLFGIYLSVIIATITATSLLTYYVVNLNENETSYSFQTDDEEEWSIPDIEGLTFNSTGNSTYFILQLGFILVLEGEEAGDSVKVIVNVTDDTEMVGGIETRVVIEKEWINDEIVEISYNYIAICNQTNDVYYFGEAVDIYENGEIVDTTSGVWRADESGNKAGILIPATPLVGARYYQEYAEDAKDRVEVMSIGSTLTLPIGTFENCLITEDTTPLEPLAREYKYYAPGIGLICEQTIYLTQYGFI